MKCIMKEHSQLKKIISILMIFILLIQLSGCMSYRIISSADLTDSNKYNYIIHSQKSKYRIENTVISNGILSGKIVVEHSNIGNKVQVYLSSDSMIKINMEKILSIPVDSIAKVEMEKFSVGKTALLVGTCVGAIIVVILLSRPIHMGDFIILGPI